ncbi:class I SAM-dependent methyltransferase [Salipiger mucosus]|uniref:Methyltransferase type 12 n=1 Tax=Salipiger mucosus DSM 16094 TaxID=1123237 RepID=S9S494_9RHOB|nr:class I SAM-dependent methyltransferase [Salipiger mucosus]EPX85000.1 Methyltransferase type 12 [Salipiger mucosus DSM 16094]
MDLPPEFLELYARLDRQGPGVPDDVLWATGRLGLAGPLRVCDEGCGTGADCATLAACLPEARIEGVDAMPAFVEAAETRLEAVPNVSVRTGDMGALEGPFDLIWSAGAIYFLGVIEGLRAWREALAPGGAVAFSQGVLPEGEVPQAVRDFWSAEPDITDQDGLLAQVEAAGYAVIDTRWLTATPWAAYYDSLEREIAALRPGASAAMTEVLDGAAREIALWRQAPEQIAYLLVLARPR